MTSDFEIKNAKIISTSLGYENHGILTAFVFVEWDGGGIGFGGNALDEVVKDKNGKFLKRSGHAFGTEFICRILKTVGVNSWEKLPGNSVRIRIEPKGLGDRSVALGNYLKEYWFNPTDLAEEYFSSG